MILSTPIGMVLIAALLLVLAFAGFWECSKGIERRRLAWAAGAALVHIVALVVALGGLLLFSLFVGWMTIPRDAYNNPNYHSEPLLYSIWLVSGTTACFIFGLGLSVLMRIWFNLSPKLLHNTLVWLPLALVQIAIIYWAAT